METSLHWQLARTFYQTDKIQFMLHISASSIYFSDRDNLTRPQVIDCPAETASRLA